MPNARSGEEKTMTHATLTRQYMAHQPTHFRGKVLCLLVLLGIGGLAGAAYLFKVHQRALPTVDAAGDSAHRRVLTHMYMTAKTSRVFL
jgi:hypothetical protein